MMLRERQAKTHSKRFGNTPKSSRSVTPNPSVPSTPIIRTPVVSDDEGINDGWSSLGSESTHPEFDINENVHWEHDLLESIENLSDKRTFIRQESLGKIIKITSMKYTHDILFKKRTEILDSLIKCLKRTGDDKESILSCRCLATIFITLGTNYANEISSEFFQFAKTQILNHQNIQIRSYLIRICGLLGYIAAQSIEKDLSELSSLQSSLLLFFSELIITNSDQDVDSSSSSIITAALHAYGLTWCAIWGEGQAIIEQNSNDINEIHTSLPENESRQRAKDEFETILPYHMTFLESHLVDVRLAAGENIALFFECLGINQGDIVKEQIVTQHDLDQLTKRLEQLSTDSSKRTSKSARKIQKSVFRDILRTINPNDDLLNITNDMISGINIGGIPNSLSNFRKLKIGNLIITLETWNDMLIMGAIRSVLRSGLVTHFLRNPLVRDIFAQKAEVDWRSPMGINTGGNGSSYASEDDEESGGDNDLRSERNAIRKIINTESKRSRQKNLKDKRRGRNIDEAQYLSQNQDDI